MAVLSVIPEVEVTVRVNGEAATEYEAWGIYDVTDEDDMSVSPANTSMKFIECVDDGTFLISLKVSEDYDWDFEDHCLYFSLYIDGNWVKSEYCWQLGGESGDWDRLINYRITKDDLGNFAKQSFRFARLAGVDGDAMDLDGPDSYISDLDQIDDIGVIEVRVCRGLEGQPANQYPLPQDKNPPDSRVLQDAFDKLDLTHRTKYTEPVRMISTPMHSECTLLPKERGPVGWYFFLYRSSEKLVSKRIKPAVQVPVVEEASEEVQAMFRFHGPGTGDSSPVHHNFAPTPAPLMADPSGAASPISFFGNPSESEHSNRESDSTMEESEDEEEEEDEDDGDDEDDEMLLPPHSAHYTVTYNEQGNEVIEILDDDDDDDNAAPAEDYTGRRYVNSDGEYEVDEEDLIDHEQINIAFEGIQEHYADDAKDLDYVP
ncbi:uncharacterized protein F4812DRAFT_467264 [Daldinia caldariorum]|uniref:uncharacterized protein n=1 Tax=Daldinia caldariorum TaxID=326644 RepID=UPI002008D102|nr:uncharacterized protein F4812DRAFT_467264 [Daldinia caldariorum]KAI1471062.1 hypothetical protein F4812DRAFT_467264 [Daldinia caldariorum]